MTSYTTAITALSLSLLTAGWLDIKWSGGLGTTSVVAPAVQRPPLQLIYIKLCVARQASAISSRMGDEWKMPEFCGCLIWIAHKSITQTTMSPKQWNKQTVKIKYVPPSMTLRWNSGCDGWGRHCNGRCSWQLYVTGWRHGCIWCHYRPIIDNWHRFLFHRCLHHNIPTTEVIHGSMYSVHPPFHITAGAVSLIASSMYTRWNFPYCTINDFPNFTFYFSHLLTTALSRILTVPNLVNCSLVYMLPTLKCHKNPPRTF